MPDVPTRIRDLAARLRRALARPRPRHWAALGAAGAAALGLVGLRSIDLPGPRAIEPHNRLHIEVVAPVEPTIEPGSRMDVGELVDAFRYTPPRAPVLEPAAYEEAYDVRDGWLDDWREPPPPRYAREPRREETFPYPPPRPERPEPARRRPEDRRWFGFDEPRRDFRAEREQRRARDEARDREWAAREREWRSRGHDDGPAWREPPRDDPRRDPRDDPRGDPRDDPRNERWGDRWN